MAETALADVRVLDLTHHIAGPYRTEILADYGAMAFLGEESPNARDPRI
jgi:crotonobetainyl-CoA:carnitine CoA-transferase CaiB-like acyl-CoA transferase